MCQPVKVKVGLAVDHPAPGLVLNLFAILSLSGARG